MILLEKNWKGLTLLEFLISVVIIAVLIIAAIPTYQHYSKKAYYGDLIQATFPYQEAVTQCLKQRQNKLTDCDAGRNGIPPNLRGENKIIESITVQNSVITAVPKARHGIQRDDTYVLTPRISDDGIDWEVSGGACKAGLVPNC